MNEHAPRPIAAPYILALGGDDPRKNTHTLIPAIRELRTDPQYATLELVIVGSTTTSDPWIHAIEKPNDQELAALYHHATAFAYPSWYEGFGLPLHEAHAHGIPCVASSTGALPETAPHGTIFADPTKPHHWTMALRMAMETSPECHCETTDKSSKQSPTSESEIAARKNIVHALAMTDRSDWVDAAAILERVLMSIAPQRKD